MSHAWGSASWLVFLGMPLLGGCGEVCCGTAIALVVLPILVVLERRLRGSALLLLGLAALSMPLWLWETASRTLFEPLGAALALFTAGLGHDLVAAFFPRWSAEGRLALGAILAGGWLGGAIGVFWGLRRSGRPAAGVLLGAAWATLGLGLLQQGPSMRQFAPGGLSWPAFAVPPRQGPVVPLRPVARRVGSGKLDFPVILPYPTERVLRAPLRRGDCGVEPRANFLAGPPLSAGLWEQLSGEPPPACAGACGPGEAVQGLTWLQAIELANLASTAWGLAAAYEVEDQKVTWFLNTSGFRLPTEVEWELLEARGLAGALPEWTWDEAGEAACGEDPAYAAQKDGRVTVNRPKQRVVRGGPKPRQAVAATQAAAGLRLVR